MSPGRVSKTSLWLAGAALLLALAFAAAHGLGLRDSVSVLSGTAPAGSGKLALGSGSGSAAGGVVYVITWLAVVVVAPTLALGAAIRCLFR